MSKVIRNTALDSYLECEKDYSSSFYQFVCRSGKVPVINGSGVQASWPLEETFCRNMLVLHWPNWRTFTDLKHADTSWIDQFNSFHETENCQKLSESRN